MHTFTKIRISFSGILKFNSDSIGYQGSIVPTNQWPTDSMPIAVQWNGFTFRFSRHNNSNYFIPDCGMGYTGVKIDYDYLQNISAVLSSNSRSIDTLSDDFSDYSYKNELHIQENHSDFQSTAVHSLPILAANQDAIIFSYHGDSL